MDRHNIDIASVFDALGDHCQWEDNHARLRVLQGESPSELVFDDDPLERRLCRKDLPQYSAQALQFRSLVGTNHFIVNQALQPFEVALIAFKRSYGVARLEE